MFILLARVVINQLFYSLSIIIYYLDYCLVWIVDCLILKFSYVHMITICDNMVYYYNNNINIKSSNIVSHNPNTETLLLCRRCWAIGSVPYFWLWSRAYLQPYCLRLPSIPQYQGNLYPELVECRDVPQVLILSFFGAIIKNGRYFN